MYAVVLILAIIAVALGFGRTSSATHTEFSQAKAKVFAEQMLVQQKSAIDSVKAYPGFFKVGVIQHSYVTYPAWFTGDKKFTSTTDAANLVVTYFPGDSALWGAMAETLAKRASATTNGGQTVGAMLAGTILQTNSGTYLQTTTKFGSKITLPASVAVNAPAGAPALVSVLN